MEPGLDLTLELDTNVDMRQAETETDGSMGLENPRASDECRYLCWDFWEVV